MKKPRQRGWGLFGVDDEKDIIASVVKRMSIKSLARHLNTRDLRAEWLDHEAKAARAQRIPILRSRCPLTGRPIVWMPNWIYPSSYGHVFGCTGFQPPDARWAINEALWDPERRARIFHHRERHHV